MSWFKHTPKVKTPSKQFTPRYSPVSEKFLEEAKRSGPNPTKTNKSVGDK
jgi:hypothetical protein